MSDMKNKVLVGATAVAVGLLIGVEGYVNRPYYDIAGILTECYGNTKGVDKSKPKTLEQCKALLDDEAMRIGTMLINDYQGHTVHTLASGISFVYNIGDGAYRGSTYRNKLKQGDHVGACMEMNKWVYVTQGGKKVKAKGLENRRAKEVALCLQES